MGPQYAAVSVLTGGHGRGLLLPLDSDHVGGGAAGLLSLLLHSRHLLLLLPLPPEPDT